MKKSLLYLSICIILLTGCGEKQDEIESAISDVNDSETIVDTVDNLEETGSMESESFNSAEVVSNHVTDAESSALQNEVESFELPAYLKNISVYLDENDGLILDIDGFLYRYIINAGTIEIDISNLYPVFGEPYEDVLDYRNVSCYPIELLAEPENILLGTLAQGIYFYPNSEYLDDSYLWDRVAGDSGIYGYIESISQESVYVFTGEENWLHDDTYLELVNVSDTATGMPLAEDVQFALLDRNFHCTEVTAARFQQLLEKNEQEERPAGSIFILYLEDGKVIQILEHYNP